MCVFFLNNSIRYFTFKMFNWVLYFFKIGLIWSYFSFVISEYFEKETKFDFKWDQTEVILKSERPNIFFKRD